MRVIPRGHIRGFMLSAPFCVLDSAILFVFNKCCFIKKCVVLVGCRDAAQCIVPEVGSVHAKAMGDVKNLLTSTPTLAFYDPVKSTIVSSDASSYGIGGGLLQQHSEGIKTVAFCSRTSTASE